MVELTLERSTCMDILMVPTYFLCHLQCVLNYINDAVYPLPHILTGQSHNVDFVVTKLTCS